MTLRFHTRTFLISFVPVVVLLVASFWMVQRLVQSTVRESQRAVLRENQLALSRIQASADLQNSRFLKVAGENAALKAGVQLLRADPIGGGAQRTVEDQLRELGEHMGFDLLLVATPEGVPLAAVIREPAKGNIPGELVPLAPQSLSSVHDGLSLIGTKAFQIGSAAIDADQENVATLLVGKIFDLSESTAPAVLLYDGEIVQSNIPNFSFTDLKLSLRNCTPGTECNLRLHNSDWISLPVPAVSATGDYSLRSLQNIDAAIAPVQTRLRRMLITAVLCSVLVLLACSMVSSRSIVRPLAKVVTHLRKAGRTGELPEFNSDLSSILEVHELTESYNRAAASVRQAQGSLHGAYIEFVGSLAQALDARDRYTAGHSWRVSQLSCAIAGAMHLDTDAVEKIRIGALLHDIGKLGISDTILQKPTILTKEEVAIVEEHPAIGRRILAGVQGLHPFLSAVESHHENWDGSGYPRGDSGEATPIDARIIHVADAYDAMTTDRSYRRGISHGEAIEILIASSGTQFDPRIVDAFVSLHRTPATAQLWPRTQSGVHASFVEAQ